MPGSLVVQSEICTDAASSSSRFTRDLKCVAGTFWKKSQKNSLTGSEVGAIEIEFLSKISFPRNRNV